MKVAYLREMHIKTTKRYHFTPTRIAAIKNTENKCWRGCGKTGTLVHCCGNVKWYSRYGKQYGNSSKN